MYSVPKIPGGPRGPSSIKPAVRTSVTHGSRHRRYVMEIVSNPRVGGLTIISTIDVDFDSPQECFPILRRLKI